MLYGNFKGTRLSRLGFGTMRLPVLDGNDSTPDIERVREMVAYAIEKGINYFDTAWGYHGGNSETALAEALEPYARDTYCLADKFPGYDLANMPYAERIFEEQLRKCRVDYFDFYLIHNVCELNINQYLDPEFGIRDYFVRQKQLGRIKHLGFSLHGSIDVMKQFLEVYGPDMEFCQIQLNWLDWSFQKAWKKVSLCRELRLPVWVMEPVRGGSLLKLSDKDLDAMKRARPDESPVGWCFRFIQSVHETVVCLSGMSDMEQLRQNIAVFEQNKPLNQRERKLLSDIAAGMTKQKTAACTACRYCTSHCPNGLDIPGLIELYNEHSFSGGGFLAPMAIMSLPPEKRPSACMGCRSCERVCPQQLNISELIKELAEKTGL